MRRRVLRIGAGVVAFAAVTGALHMLGVGGYRGGFAWTAVVLGGGGGLATGILLRHSSGMVWGLAVAVAGAAMGGLLAEAAPVSTGRLADQMDDLQLPFFEAMEERRSGHSWCRPTCPVVERLYDPPDVSPSALAVTTGAAFLDHGLIEDQQLQSLVRQNGFRLVTDDVRIRVSIGDDRVTIRYEALR